MGVRFGDLTIVLEIDRHVKPSGQSSRMVLCKCYCGNTFSCMLFSVKSGKTKSCGCLQKERTSKASTKHSMSSSQIWGVYSAMKRRCTNKKCPDYKDYGGRGITYCDRWASFENFLSDMLESYRPGYSLERDDVDGIYEPSNCRWIPMIEQAQNKRNTIRTIFEGTRMSLRKACRESGYNYYKAYREYNRGQKHFLYFQIL